MAKAYLSTVFLLNYTPAYTVYALAPGFIEPKAFVGNVATYLNRCFFPRSISPRPIENEMVLFFVVLGISLSLRFLVGQF